MQPEIIIRHTVSGGENDNGYDEVFVSDFAHMHERWVEKDQWVSPAAHRRRWHSEAALLDLTRISVPRGSGT